MASNLNILEKLLTKMAEEIKSNLESQKVNASGNLSRSIHVTMYEGGGMISTPLSYLKYTETGSSPHKVRGFFYIIRKWILDKKITWQPIPYKTNRPHKYTPEERGLNQLAWSISYSIQKNGTRLFRDGGRDTIYTNVVKNHMADITKIAKEIITIKLTEIKNGR